MAHQDEPDRPDDAFRPFDNDTQVMTFTDGQDELTLENGPDAVLLAGMREHYPAITLACQVQLITHLTPEQSQSLLTAG